MKSGPGRRTSLRHPPRSREATSEWFLLLAYSRGGQRPLRRDPQAGWRGEAPAKWPESWSRAKAVPTAWGGLAQTAEGRGEDTTPPARAAPGLGTAPVTASPRLGEAL